MDEKTLKDLNEIALKVKCFIQEKLEEKNFSFHQVVPLLEELLITAKKATQDTNEILKELTKGMKN